MVQSSVCGSRYHSPDASGISGGCGGFWDSGGSMGSAYPLGVGFSRVHCSLKIGACLEESLRRLCVGWL